MSGYYILDANGQPVPVDRWTWANWYGRDRGARQIARTDVGEVTVSTVFLGMNHQWGDGPPLIFETMIFEGEWNDWQWRWSTRAEAEENHGEVVAALREGRPPLDAGGSDEHQ